MDGCKSIIRKSRLNAMQKTSLYTAKLNEHTSGDQIIKAKFNCFF